MPRMLSKSRVMAARQCRRRLWLEVHRPDLRVVPDALERRFRQGHAVNDVVHGLHPEAVLIGPEVPLGEALQRTARHLARTPERPLFEATFSKHRVLVRADIFQRLDGGWRLTEVKSSTTVKPYHLLDCAIQAWVIGAAGYPVEQLVLAHIDTGFVYGGDGDYRGLLREVDVTAEAADWLPEVPRWVEEGLAVLGGNEPLIAVGPHCTDPFDCPFIGHCSPPPPAYPVSALPNGGRVVEELLAEGIDDIRDIPAGRLARPLQERVRAATVSGEPYLDPALGVALRSLPYPRYSLDFETIQFAVPIWAGTRPYEQLPFQWSCHVESVDGTLRHHEFLDTTGEAPLRACAEALLEALGQEGPILTYSAFERTVIKGLAARFPDLAPALQGLIDRIVDLLPLVRAHYYHPAMKGSFSIKTVLPTVVPQLDYGALDEVRDGVAAQAAYEELIAADTPDARRQALAEALRRYCALDTLAMVELVRGFSRR